MRTRSFSRRLIGLLAAYLVALPALILPLAMPSAAAAAGLCTAEQGVPSGHDPACPCAAVCGMQCQTPALGDGETSPLPAPHMRVVAVLAPAALAAVSHAAIRRPQLPRGPPAA